MAVRRAMTDQAIKEVLRKEVADQVVNTVSADLDTQMRRQIAKEVAQIEAHVAEKISKDLLESLTLATTVLREGFQKAQDTAPASSGMQRPVLAEAEPPVKDQEARSTYFGRMSAAGKVAALALALALLASGYLIGWGVSTARQRTEQLVSQAIFETPVPTSSLLPPPAKLSIDAQRIKGDWMKAVMEAEDQLTPDSLLRRLYGEHSPSDQFACWFSRDASQKLEKLARGGSSPRDTQQELDYIFQPCFDMKPPLRDPMLAIFSAQATVAVTFSRYRAEWESWCATADEASPPFLVGDGFPGPATWEGMNLFLKCVGHNGDLAIEPSSTTSQYLYVTYLALRELQR